MAFNIGFYAYAIIGHTRADQLLPQLLMEQFDTLPIQCRHIEHMHEGVWFRKNNFWQNDSCENLDNYSLIGILYMHRWCLHRPINSYHSFWWSNLILFLYNVDTLNICMKEFGSEKIIFDKITAMRTMTIWQNYSYENLDNFSLTRLLNMHRWCLLNLTVQGFSLNLTVRGVSHKHCLLTFFISNLKQYNNRLLSMFWISLIEIIY